MLSNYRPMFDLCTNPTFRCRCHFDVGMTMQHMGHITVHGKHRAFGTPACRISYVRAVSRCKTNFIVNPLSAFFLTRILKRSSWVSKCGQSVGK